MKKGTAVFLLILFAASFLVGVLTTSSEAVTCYTKCVNGLAYRCCVQNGVETCVYKPNIDCIRR